MELYEFLEHRKLLGSFLKVVDDHNEDEGREFLSFCQRSISTSRVRLLLENINHLFAAMKSIKRSVFSSFEFFLKSDESSWKNQLSEGRLTTKGLIDLNEFMLQRSIRVESFIELRDDPPALHRAVWHDLADFFTNRKDKVDQARNNFTLLASSPNYNLNRRILQNCFLR